MNSKMIIKVCGMGDTARMHQLAALPVDMLGFIFYPNSPRFVVGKITPTEIDKLPAQIQRVGVFVNATKEEILHARSTYHLTALQLHGNETADLCHELKAEGFTILKAFNLNNKIDYEAYAPHCDYFLFDTPSKQHGGTGQKFNWALLENYKGTTPFLLSGGIGPDDAEMIMKIDHPQFAGIDINSKFEVEPGIKNVEQIKEFIKPTPQPPKGGVRNNEIDCSVHLITPRPPEGGERNCEIESSESLFNKQVQLQKSPLGPVPIYREDLGVTNMFYGAEPILFEFAKQLRLNPTDAEDFLWRQLSSQKIKGIRFKRQHPISYFIADFYCHKVKLIIEVDGGYHKIPSQYEYDCNRDHELNELGLKVLRFTNEQVLLDIENVLKRIEEEINHPPPPKGGAGNYQI
jgi:phosphoribosylanthranilate isomerase